MMLFAPDATASSTPYWIIGLSTSGSISFGCAFVAGRKRVPRPAAGKTAFRTSVFTSGPSYHLGSMLDLVLLRDRIDDARRRLGARSAAAVDALNACAAVDARWRQL